MNYRTPLFCALCGLSLMLTACGTQQADNNEPVTEPEAIDTYSDTPVDWDANDSEFIVVDNTDIKTSDTATTWPVTYEPKTQKGDSLNSSDPFATTSMSRPTTEYSTTTSTQENDLTTIAYEESTTVKSQPMLLNLPWEQENVRRWARIDESSNRKTIYIRPNMRLLIDLPNFKDQDIVWANPKMLFNGRHKNNGGYINETPKSNDYLSNYPAINQMGSNTRMNPNNSRHTSKMATRTFCYLNIKETGVVRLRMHAVNINQQTQILDTYEIIVVVLNDENRLSYKD